MNPVARAEQPAFFYLVPAPKDETPPERPTWRMRRRRWLTSDKPAWWPESRTRLRLVVLEGECEQNAVKVDRIFEALAEMCTAAGMPVEKPSGRHLRLVRDPDGSA
jgi:hypothetical protein